MKILLVLWVVSVSILVSGTAEAAGAADPMLDTSRLCAQNFARSEREQGIPKQLLSAIAITESGRWSDEAHAVVPWPWTINAQGQGYYFDTMHEAITFAKRLQQKGVSSMDVGCMQVNLHHHPDAFANLLDAFDPALNVAYGAKFLRNNYDDLHNWPEAIGAYHSRTPKHSQPYYASVRRNWAKVLHGGDFAIAEGGSSPYGATTTRIGGVAIRKGMPEKRKDSTFQVSVREDDGFRRLKDERRKIETRMPTEASIIRVAETRKSPEVLVVRPENKEASRKASSEELTPASEILAGSKPEAIEKDPAVIRLAMTGNEGFVSGKQQHFASDTSPEVKKQSSRKSGPNFIFD